MKFENRIIHPPENHSPIWLPVQIPVASSCVGGNLEANSTVLSTSFGFGPAVSVTALLASMVPLSSFAVKPADLATAVSPFCLWPPVKAAELRKPSLTFTSLFGSPGSLDSFDSMIFLLFYQVLQFDSSLHWTYILLCS